MTGSKLIDSSVWLSYFLNGEFQNIIESEEIIFLSALSIFEIKKKLSKNNFPHSKISESLEFIKKRSIIVPINVEIAEKAAEISLNHNLPAADSLIYSTSLLNDSILHTIDNDFRGLKGVLIL